MNKVAIFKYSDISKSVNANSIKGLSNAKVCDPNHCDNFTITKFQFVTNLENTIMNQTTSKFLFCILNYRKLF